MTLTQEQVEWVRSRVSRWLEFEGVDASPAGADHSSLLTRLLSGKEPTEHVPPTAFSYPWYALEEGKKCPVEDASYGPYQCEWKGADKIVICQTGYLKADWDDDTMTGLLMYEKNGQKYRITREGDHVWFQKEAS